MHSTLWDPCVFSYKRMLVTIRIHKLTLTRGCAKSVLNQSVNIFWTPLVKHFSHRTALQFWLVIFIFQPAAWTCAAVVWKINESGSGWVPKLVLEWFWTSPRKCRNNRYLVFLFGCLQRWGHDDRIVQLGLIIETWKIHTLRGEIFWIVLHIFAPQNSAITTFTSVV